MMNMQWRLRHLSQIGFNFYSFSFLRVINVTCHILFFQFYEFLQRFGCNTAFIRQEHDNVTETIHELKHEVEANRQQYVSVDFKQYHTFNHSILVWHCYVRKERWLKTLIMTSYVSLQCERLKKTAFKVRHSSNLLYTVFLLRSFFLISTCIAKPKTKKNIGD